MKGNTDAMEHYVLERLNVVSPRLATLTGARASPPKQLHNINSIQYSSLLPHVQLTTGHQEEPS
jgi:hypothetical protein